MTCNYLTKAPDWPRLVCGGEPAIEHKCSYWAFRGFKPMPVTTFGPTFPYQRITCTQRVPSITTVLYAAWQTYLDVKRVWPQTGYRTETMPLDLKYLSGTCPLIGYQLP
jgi:hypothetical protein